MAARQAANSQLKPGMATQLFALRDAGRHHSLTQLREICTIRTSRVRARFRRRSSTSPRAATSRFTYPHPALSLSGRGDTQSSGTATGRGDTGFHQLLVGVHVAVGVQRGRGRARGRERTRSRPSPAVRLVRSPRPGLLADFLDHPAAGPLHEREGLLERGLPAVEHVLPRDANGRLRPRDLDRSQGKVHLVVADRLERFT